MMKTVILFDLDDTLFDRNEYIRKTYNYLCSKLNFSKDVSSYMFSEYLIAGEKNIFQKTIKKYNIDDDFLNKMINLYQNSQININLYKDVENFFKNNNYFRFGLVTNGGTKTQRNKIKLLHLDNIFEKIIISGELFSKEDWKPSKKPFEYIMSEMNIKPEQCIYIGDKIDTDIYGAINANILPILINRNSQINITKKKINKYDYYEINSFDNLEDLLTLIKEGDVKC